MPDFSSNPLPPPSDDYVPQFSTVQYMPPSGTEQCARCSTLLTSQFFVVKGAKLCPACAMQAGSGESAADHAAFVRALLFGIGGAVAGLVLYSAVIVATHITIGYLALAVGWMVGTAMMKGSNGRGGSHYQIAAALLTYGAISLSSIPIYLYYIYQRHVPVMNVAALMERLLIYGLLSPFLSFGRSPAWAVIGLIILFVGIRIAWRITRAKQLPVAGPYKVGAV
jgi:hypothetical protein